MKFKPKLVRGTLIKRYKRFLADVELHGSHKKLTAHIPNSGSMLGVSEPGSLCLLSVSNNPKRKLSHTLEIIKSKNSWVGVNTANANKLVLEAFHDKLIPLWRDYDVIQSEVKINSKSRLDFLLSNSKSTHPKSKRYVEVKNVSMGEPPCALFPDAVTIRGQKHLRELMKLSKKGFETEIIFVVQRNDCKNFRPCDDIDPSYGKLLRTAAQKGVHVSCWDCEIDGQKIKLAKSLDVQLK